MDYAIGRDIRPDDIGKISATLLEWCQSCETVLNCVEEQIDRANAKKAVVLRHKEDIDHEVWFKNFLLAFKGLLTEFLLLISR